MLRELEVKIPKKIFRYAMELDRNYIAPRHPDAYTEGIPFDYYSEEIAMDLIDYAENVIEFIKKVKGDVKRA